jgi:hypothetical protein
MEKVKLYNKVNIYKNAIPKAKEYTELLKKSEKENPHHLFKKWDDWYGFGLFMNLDQKVDKSYNIDYNGNPIDLNDEYAVQQMNFLNDIHDVYYKVTSDYIKEYDVKLPNWVISGWSLSKYTETPEERSLAMHYHTDYVGANADAPGSKFAITCTMYLNDDYDGGEISFLDEEQGAVVTFKPSAGDVVVFPSGDPITGTSHYFHGVGRVSNGEKYLVRTFWHYNYEGSKEWWEGVEKYGKEEWEIIHKEKFKKSLASGKWHRYIVHEGDSDPKVSGSTPFFVKKIGNNTFLPDK